MATQALADRAERAAGHTRLFGACVVATLLVTSLGLPWRLSGLGFGAVAVYAGIRLLVDLSELHRTGHPAPGRVGVVIGIGLTAFMMLVLVGQAALYPLVAEQDHCLATAVTHQDRQQCHQQFDRRQQELLRRLRGEPRVGAR